MKVAHEARGMSMNMARRRRGLSSPPTYQLSPSYYVVNPGEHCATRSAREIGGVNGLPVIRAGKRRRLCACVFIFVCMCLTVYIGEKRCVPFQARQGTQAGGRIVEGRRGDGR